MSNNKKRSPKRGWQNGVDRWLSVVDFDFDYFEHFRGVDLIMILFLIWFDSDFDYDSDLILSWFWFSIWFWLWFWFSVDFDSILILSTNLRHWASYVITEQQFEQTRTIVTNKNNMIIYIPKGYLAAVLVSLEASRHYLYTVLKLSKSVHKRKS